MKIIWVLPYCSALCDIWGISHPKYTNHQKMLFSMWLSNYKLSPNSLKDYAERNETRWEHYPIIVDASWVFGGAMPMTKKNW